jgi:dTDP-4-dehydrorhamnose reductase
MTTILPPKRILITGGSGLLALNWACCMRDECEVYLARHSHDIRLRGTRVVPLELESIDNLLRRLEEYRPEWVVHTAGITNVDQCEREPAKAHEANAMLARNVASATARLGLRLIHISTDHLFSGTRSMYREDDAPEPLNEYARTKLLAEQCVTQAHPSALIVRTNFFGWGHAARRSFSDWIIDSLGKGEALTLFDDVYFTPILADRLAIAAHRLLEQGAAGAFNVAGDERVSKYDFALRIAKCFALPEVLIRHGKISQAALAARRPPDMSLDNGKARAALGAGLGLLEEYFDDLRRQQRSGRTSELLHAVTTG